MGKKFDEIFESVISRYQVGGYLPGDLIKFRPDYKNTPCYNAMHSIMKQELEEVISSGLNIKVVSVGSNRNNTSYAIDPLGAHEAIITIACDYGGGRHYGTFAVTPDMIDILDASNPSPTVPDQFYRPDNTNWKPEEYMPDVKNITRLTDKGNGKNTATVIKLAGESTRLKQDNASIVNLYEQITK